MKLIKILFLGAVVIGAFGCGDNTAVSVQPTKDEIEAGKQRRLAEIEKLNIPEAAKARMRAQVSGGSPQGAVPPRN